MSSIELQKERGDLKERIKKIDEKIESLKYFQQIECWTANHYKQLGLGKKREEKKLIMKEAEKETVFSKKENSRNYPLAFLSEYTLVIPPCKVDFGIMENDESKNKEQKHTRNVGDNFQLDPTEYKLIHSELTEDIFKELIKCIDHLKSLMAYVKVLQTNVESHHLKYMSTEKLQDFKHSERLFTYNMKSTFETWANWESLEEMNIFLISTHPSCKLKEEKKFKLNLTVISRLLGNQEPEFTHIEKEIKWLKLL
eukprot:gene3637-6453_t